MAGVPRSMYLPFPFQIFQTPRLIAMVYEFVHSYRPIYLDGATKHFDDADFWMGHSIGRWDGDTAWFDMVGDFHSPPFSRRAHPAGIRGDSDLDLVVRRVVTAAFGRRCIPLGSVAPRSNIPDTLARRALPGGSIAALGATP